MPLLNRSLRVASRIAQRSTRTSAPIRTKTSLIPPNVSSLKELGKLQSAYPQAHPDIFKKMKYFYQHIPKGNRQQTASTTFWGRYYERYIAKDSFVPVLHFLGIMIPTGYYISYFKGGPFSPYSAVFLDIFASYSTTTPASSSIKYMHLSVEQAWHASKSDNLVFRMEGYS
ncbi:hypothetical protein PhCBS80983_g05029 [Powellomyces hirtus]|uniref:Uncharacterized protein n=1 Tax=Powellomyces hirtus TaxID=109895 RepID=A0A507DXU5_9FUNG|nr:hypothetical protein PhCBS80983_g05029 [Powellomyces hirtus]